MKLGRVGAMALLGGACLATGCVTYTTVQSPAAMPSVTAHIQVRGPALANVPDVPSVVGGRVDGNAIHAALDRFGSWGEDPAYGAVWYPESAPQGFVPYGTDGNWQLTDAGMYWQSRLPWGWLTFHYGRWVEVSARWAWVPGALFAPAWVDWRTTNGYVGWSPLPPEGATYSSPYAFCPCGQMMSQSVWSSCAYGASAMGYYASSVALPLSYGYGGALYGWGPTPSTLGGWAGGVPVSVPVATAWHGGPVPARPIGAPAMATSGNPTPVGAGSQPRSGAPTMGSSPVSGTPPVPVHVGTPMATTFPMPGSPVARPGAYAAPFVRPALVPVAPPSAGEPQHTRWVATVPSAGEYDSHAMVGRYRTADTVVISDQVPASRMNQTISLGTSGVGGYERAPSSFSGSFGSIPSSAGYAPSPSTGYAPSGGYSRTSATTYSTAPAYGGAAYHTGGYSTPSYNGASVYAPAATGGAATYSGATHYNSAPTYTAPAYTAPAYTAPSYTAPSFTPSYAPAGGGGYHIGGGGTAHFGGRR